MESCVHLESTDYGSDLSVSDTDSMQPVTESSSGAQSRSSSVQDYVHLGHLSYLERGRFKRTYHLLVSAGPNFVVPSQQVGEFQG